MSTASCGGFVALANPTAEYKKTPGPTSVGAGGPQSWAHDATTAPDHQAPRHTERSLLIAMWLLASDWEPYRTVAELRRKCRYAGFTMTAAGRPIRFARRAELLALLQQQEVG